MGLPSGTTITESTPYVTFPPMEDLRTHRVDIAKRQMMSAQPIAPVLRRMAEVLHAGHTVWLIGGLNYVTPGRQPLSVPPGFDGPDGWVGDVTIPPGRSKASFLVQTHAKNLGAHSRAMRSAGCSIRRCPADGDTRLAFRARPSRSAKDVGASAFRSYQSVVTLTFPMGTGLERSAHGDALPSFFPDHVSLG